MKKPLLLSAILGVATAFSIAQGAFAISQDIQGTLAGSKTVTVLSGQNVATTIDTFSGSLSSQLNPGFVLASNDGTGTATLTATVDATTPGLTALSSPSPGIYYVALANATTKPTDGAVADALGAGPTATSNANCIAYPISTPVVNDIDPGLGLSFSYSAGTFTSATTGAGKSNVINNIGPAARGNTFSPLDTVGNYITHMIMTFT